MVTKNSSLSPSIEGNHTASQSAAILRHLQSGKSITQLEALDKFQCFRLGARIFTLKSEGHPIVSEMISKNGKRFASYSIKNDAQEGGVK